MFTKWGRKCRLNPTLFVIYYMPLETKNLYFKARVLIHCGLMVKIYEIKAKLLCRLCHQALHPPFYGIAAMLTAATSADKRCKPNSTGPTVSFFKIKPCDKNIWKIINHHNHHGTIRTSLSISCVINCTNPLIGDSETIYQI